MNGDLAQKETELTNLRETHERTVAAMRSAEEALGAADGKINELQAELESVREAAALTTGTRTPEFLSPEKHTTSVPPSPSTLSHAMVGLVESLRARFTSWHSLLAPHTLLSLQNVMFQSLPSNMES